MPNINLSQLSRDESDKVKLKIFDKGFYISVGMIFLTILVWAGLMFYNGLLEKKMTEISDQINDKTTLLKSQNAARVADFQNRLDKISAHVSGFNNSNPGNCFVPVEKLILPEVAVDTFKCDNDKKEITFSATSAGGYKTVARQLVALNDSNYLANVALNSMNKGEKTVSFSITAAITYSGPE
ncbi:MAG: hypothetical protein A3J63_03400 [Candidatus Moranbacteria bacterium RIFCSPHIGHO2_02_FULL_40_12b]|nr:MAG: hypothetical protein A3J63_03400 [Candidatus Moranbacteria bacterium RIFCSPHIGHO2_02_FULL_40_12b]